MELLQTLKGHVGRVWHVSWNPEGNVLASCGEDKTIRLWWQESNDPFALGLKTILTDGHQRTIRSVGWSPCGQYLASASFDSTVAIWNKKSGQFECDVSLEGHENEVKSVAWSKSGQYLATSSRDKSVWIWETSDEEEYECAAVLNAHSQDVKKVVWHPHIDVVASASYDNTLKVFQCDANECEWICASTLRSHESTVWSLDFDSSGKRLASCSDDQTVKIWQQYEPNNEFGIATPDNEAVWKCVCTIAGYHNRTIYDISWCHLTDLIATGCADDGIRIFKEADNSNVNEPTFQQVVNYESAHSQDVNTVQWNPVHRGILASCSDDGEIKIWKVKESIL